MYTHIYIYMYQYVEASNSGASYAQAPHKRLNVAHIRAGVGGTWSSRCAWRGLDGKAFFVGPFSFEQNQQSLRVIESSCAQTSKVGEILLSRLWGPLF